MRSCNAMKPGGLPFSADGEQLIRPHLQVHLPFIDISGLPPADREAEALRIATEDAQRPIAINTAPLFRVKVVRMSVGEHRLYLTFHHIIFDGVSIARIFMPELSAIYAALEKGDLSSLPSSPPVQYGDYAIWRQGQLDSPEMKHHVDYWVKQLAPEPPLLCLPEDYARPAIASHSGAVERFRIPAELAGRLRGLSRAQGVTLYMTLLAAFNVLLFRYSGQSDFVVGNATDARRRPELENVMGYFLDTFAIRTKPVTGLAFSKYLSQTREAMLGALAAADVPFDRVVKEVNPSRDAGRHPVFQVFFTMRPPMPVLAGGWKINQTEVIAGTTKFDLHLETGNSAGELDARFFYRTDLWDAGTIRRMAGHWVTLLESIAETPDATLESLNMLTKEETAQMLGAGGWNDTAQSCPQQSLSALIEEQVRRTPDAVAAIFGSERWTYAELNARADVLASALIGTGVTRGSIVAIVLERSLDMLAGLIATHKAGAAYLPLDIQLPPARIELCLRDAEPAAILTQRSLAKLTPGNTPRLLVEEDLKKRVGAGRGDSKVAYPVGRPDDTAYLIYTSGTTGTPKAVEISQGNLVNLLTSMQRLPGFGSDIFLAVTSISFDIAAMELFLPLISGGTVVIASREEVQDPYLLAKAIKRSHCTVVQATPAMWRTLLLSGWEGGTVRSSTHATKPLRVLSGGESLSRDLADRLLATGAEVWNMYGPTETTVWSLIHRVQPKNDSVNSAVRAGLPIANTTAFVLDAQRRILPVGIPGDLFLGGAGLAKGYRGRPQETADRFQTVESVGQERLYDTGDLAKRHADGTIEILGRRDNQVKIRGYRVEIEAVEAAILQHPRVAATAVRAWPDETGNKRLVTYVVATNGAVAPILTDLRTFLAKSLPDWMIPSEIIPLSAIPLTPHGKIDRNRLPLPLPGKPMPQQQALTSPEEARVAKIWSELLGVSQPGANDNFFDLGGHSVLLAVLQQRIKSEFGQLIPFAELLHYPTIRQQAQLTRRSAERRSALPAGVFGPEPNGSRAGLFWMNPLGPQFVKGFGTERPLFSVTLTPEDVASFSEHPSLEELAAIHVSKVLATQARGPYMVGGFCAGSILAYEIASQLMGQGQDVSLLVMMDAPNPTYIEQRSRALADRLSQLRYWFQRSHRLGPQRTYRYFVERVRKRFPRITLTGGPETDLKVAQKIIETAAFAYRPRMYDGNVLLLLAGDRPAHIDFVPGWQAVVTRELNVQVVNSHHRDLLIGDTAWNVARTIGLHLAQLPVHS